MSESKSNGFAEDSEDSVKTILKRQGYFLIDDKESMLHDMEYIDYKKLMRIFSIWHEVKNPDLIIVKLEIRK